MASIYGSAHYRDGSKCDGTATITNSWDSNRAYPKNGQYRLELAYSNPKQKVKVYVNGMSFAEIYVDGDTRLDVIVH